MGIFTAENESKTLPKRKTAIPVTEFTPQDFSFSENFKLYKPQLKEAAASAVQVYESGITWEFPSVPHRSIYEYYLKDPGIQSAVNAYRNEIIGPGFYVTAEDDSVVEFVKEWNTKHNFESKLSILLGDTLMLGLALAEVIQDKDFDIVPTDMRSIIACRRDKFGKIEFYIQQTMNQTYKDLPADQFLRFSHIDVGRMAWPIGIFHSLVIPFFEFENEPWSLADVDALMRQDYARIIHKMAAPRVWHVYENAGEEKLKDQMARDKLMKPGERGYVNAKFEIMQEQLDTSGRFKDYIEVLTNAKENALQAPTAKLMTATGISNATYASAESGREMFSRSLEGIKRRWEEQIEQQIYKPLLELNGFDIAKTKLEFHWGVPDKTEITLDQVISLVGSGIIDRDEAREAIRQMNFPLADKVQQEKKRKPMTAKSLEQLK